MKRLLAILALLILFVATAPIYARESHAGRPGDQGGISITSRESHAGKPSSPGVSATGSINDIGSGSLGGGSSRFGWAFWPVFSPIYMAVPGTFFSLFLFDLL
jgi:hypothetical protein